MEANGFRAPGSDEPLDGWDFEAEREWIESLPEGPVELTADMTEVGVGSSKYGIYTYNTSGGRVDPINAMWVGNGSDEQVRWDLLNVTSPTWESTGCGGTQRARIDDSIHTGGYYTEKRQDTQLEHHGGICGERRYHVRLFGSVVRDSHGTNGWWTIGDAHEDATGHRCARDFTGARRHLEEAYRRSDGSYMFFVDDIYYIWYGNFNFDGGCDGANHNGYGVVFVIN